MASHSFKRNDRVGQLIYREIGNVLRFDVNDPRLESVTVTGVRLTEDLKDATVFVAVTGEDKRSPLENLRHAVRFIRACLGRRCYLKFVPRLNFKLDSSLEVAARIDRLIDGLNAEKDQFSPETRPEPAAEQE